jgi:glycosyltransferase involved in cell wall biosynthesis
LGNRSPAAVPEVLVADLINSRPDVVHMHHTQVPANVVIGNHLRRQGIPYCVTLHGALVGEARNRRRVLKQLYRRLWEQEHLDEAAFLHAVSRVDAAGARESGLMAPIEVVPNGIDIASRESSESARLDERFSEFEGRRVVVFVGRLDPMQKGLDILCEALRRSGVALGLLIVGPTFRNGRAELETLVRREGIAEQVVFAGPAFGSEKWTILAGADAFVHTSRWEAGVPFSVLEAAAQGLPCLLSEPADPDAILTNAGGAIRVFPDVDSIADGLKALESSSDQELELMGTRARESVRSEFSWSRIADRLVAAYRAHC